MVINGKSVVFTDETFKIDYSLPKLAPYVGVRYVQRAFNSKGWEGFAELGMLIAEMKYTTSVSANLIDSGLISDSDVQAEAKSMRKSIYRWGVVPNALVGLSYRY